MTHGVIWNDHWALRTDRPGNITCKRTASHSQCHRVRATEAVSSTVEELFTLLDCACHLCIVPLWTDDPRRESVSTACRQPVDRWSTAGRPADGSMVDRWSTAGRPLVDRWSTAGRVTFDIYDRTVIRSYDHMIIRTYDHTIIRSFNRPTNPGRPLVDRWSTAGRQLVDRQSISSRSLVDRWSTAGRPLVDCRS